LLFFCNFFVEKKFVKLLTISGGDSYGRAGWVEKVTNWLQRENKKIPVGMPCIPKGWSFFRLPFPLGGPPFQVALSDGYYQGFLFVTCVTHPLQVYTFLRLLPLPFCDLIIAYFCNFVKHFFSIFFIFCPSGAGTYSSPFSASQSRYSCSASHSDSWASQYSFVIGFVLLPPEVTSL